MDDSDRDMLLASLPWYDLKEIRWATDALWKRIALSLRQRGFAEAPRMLNRKIPYERQWKSTRFLFGQACGYDIRISRADRLQLLATPTYTAPGCSTGAYCSFVVVRCGSQRQSLEDLRGARCVINTPTSHSGMNVLRALVAPLHCDGRFFGQVTVSGSHENSLRMIRRRQVDVAAIDCVTHGLLSRYRPAELSGTRVLHKTRRVPAPPFVTSASTSPEMVARIRDALRESLDDRALQPAKDALLLNGVMHLPLSAYSSIAAMESSAHSVGYREMTVHDEWNHQQWSCISWQ